MSDTVETPALAPEAAADASAGAALPDGITETAQDEPDTFPRSVVQDLRSENAERRKAATDATQRADDLSRQLFLAKVSATGKMADPADVAYDPDLVGDDDALNAAIDSTLAAHPHYASRRPVPGTSIGQGLQGSPVAPKPSLIEAIRAQQGH